MREERLGRGTLIYAAFVVYGSLVPLAWRYRPLAEAWQAFRQTPYLELGLGSRADWVANILLYIPLAFLLSGGLARKIGRGPGCIVAFSLCAVLAIAVEFAQLYFPPRTVSLNDILAECIGTALGIVLWHAAGAKVLRLWREWWLGGREAGRALIALYSAAYLAFSLFPYDFIVTASELALKLATPGRLGFVVTQSCGAALPCVARLAAEVLTAAPLGVFLGMLAGPARRPGLVRAFGWGLLLGAAIEGLQTFIASGVTQGASVLTRGAGMALGLALHRLPRRQWLSEHRTALKIGVLVMAPLYGALIVALNGFFGSRMAGVAEALSKLQQVRFLPFYYHYFTSETQAMYSLLVHAGAYAPIGIAVWVVRNGRGDRGSLWLSAMAAAVAAASMETLKLFMVDKRPDPTNVLIAGAAAALAALVATRFSAWNDPSPPTSSSDLPLRRRAWHRPALVAATVLGLAAVAGWIIAMQPREHYVDETRLPQLPAPDALPPVSLPHFKTAHPRLPSPGAAELAILRKHNPGYLAQVQQRAAGGHGEVEAAVLQELAASGSVDLGLVHGRLMQLKFAWRGHEQVKPLAVAYDWLHARWSEPQRTALRDKLAEGCDYLIDFIRKERLSPYNVILYNAPLQGLMACSIALYKDHPRGEHAMRFTHDLWKNRVLPVWRQVMGRSGGWHEGGEYVGIGIGQAIYQVPAMWRAATGEDLIASEPGIRGFLDFLIYRTQPDGTHFRWGDGAWFNRAVPDAVPLALELRHAAAYTLQAPPQAPAPSGWPWGPLTDPTLVDPKAQLALPLARHFDGTGLIVARSDWSAEATYVTFKAGDNYWSHSHLDQGAFTVYKGAPLAIDSGLYGPQYGSDHHMNYTYQTIAHNALTVTDPADMVPAPGEEKLRAIANDGGQRRVGSGWGVEAAPIDRAEWEEKRAVYHTGELQKFFDGDALAIAVAEVTPAYTNALSGRGTFSHRTRRVERFWRVFGYDREDDVIVVFDQVRATQAEFRKRWLLHTVEAPQVGTDGFRVIASAQNRPGRGGGRLEGKVLLPRGAVINAVGGPGLEFLVDDRNYDEGGKLRELLKRLQPGQGEPGAWRVEVMPPTDAQNDLFLVVLLPSTLSKPAAHSVRLLESGERVGAEVAGPSRTTRWWFTPGENGVEVEVSAGGATRTHSVLGRANAVPAKQSWLRRVLGGDSSN